MPENGEKMDAEAALELLRGYANKGCKTTGEIVDDLQPAYNTIIHAIRKPAVSETLGREIQRRREAYMLLRNFPETDPVARSCYQAFINVLNELEQNIKQQEYR